MPPLINESAYLLLCIIAYGLFFYGIFSRGGNNERHQTKVKIFVSACLFLFLTAALSTYAGNQAMGLLNLGLAVLAGVLALVNSAEVLPNV